MFGNRQRISIENYTILTSICNCVFTQERKKNDAVKNMENTFPQNTISASFPSSYRKQLPAAEFVVGARKWYNIQKNRSLSLRFRFLGDISFSIFVLLPQMENDCCNEKCAFQMLQKGHKENSSEFILHYIQREDCFIFTLNYFEIEDFYSLHKMA